MVRGKGKPASRRFGSDEYDELKKHAIPAPDLEPVSGVEQFRLPDGRTVVAMGRAGTIYESGELERAVREEPAIETGRTTSHYLEGRSLGADFDRKAGALAAGSRRWLEASGIKFDGTIESIDELDRAREIFGEKKCLQSPEFAMLVAATGEVMRSQKPNVRWKMRVPSGGGPNGIREAWLVDDVGWQVDVGSLVYDWINGHPPRLRLAIALAEKVRPPKGPRGIRIR